MTDEAKSAPAVGATGAGAENQSGHSLDSSNAIIPQEASQRKPSAITCQIVKARLPHGRDNAKKSAELIAETGLENRVFRKSVELLRLAGMPVLSGDAGYWLADLSTPEGQHEAARFLRQESHRSRAIYRRLAPLRNSIAAAQAAEDGQIRFSEVV